MQLRQKVRRPRDAVRLPRTRRMLHQILPARPLRQHRALQFPRHLKLMIPRKNHPLHLPLLIPLRDQIAPQDFQPALPCPHLLPQIRRAMPARCIHRIPRRPFVAQIEGQKIRRLPRQPRHHRHRAIAHREMHQRPARESQQRLALRLAIQPILVDRIPDPLREIRLQFHRRHRQPVQEKHEVDAVLILK